MFLIFVFNLSKLHCRGNSADSSCETCFLPSPPPHLFPFSMKFSFLLKNMKCSRNTFYLFGLLNSRNVAPILNENK